MIVISSGNRGSDKFTGGGRTPAELSHEIIYASNPSNFNDATEKNLSKRLNDHVIVVGAYYDSTGFSDVEKGMNLQVSSYTNLPLKGNSDDSFILAPGGSNDSENISKYSNSIYSLASNNAYVWKVGTSMAAPHVAGVAGLILQAKKFSAKEVKSILISSADTGNRGYKYLRADKAIDMALSRIPTKINNSIQNKNYYVGDTFNLKFESTNYIKSSDLSVHGFGCGLVTNENDNWLSATCTPTTAGIVKLAFFNSNGEQIDSDIDSLSVVTPTLAPFVPTLTDLGSGSVRVSWASVSGAGTYEVYRGQTLISTTASTSIDDAGQTPGSEVCYRVRAIANGVASTYSPQQCITPAAPKCANQWTTGYTSAGGTESGTQSCPAGQVGSIALSHTCSSSGVWGTTTTKNTCAAVPVSCKGTWTSVSYSVGQTETSSQACSTGYSGQTTQSHVCQSNGSWGTTTTNNGCVLAICNGTWTGQQYSVGQTEEQFTNTCPTGTTGQVRQFHTCQSGGTWTPTANSDNCTATLGVPQNLLASVVSSGIQITWSSVPGATGYRIYRNNDTSGVYYTQAGTGTTYVDTAVVSGQTYTYAVAAQSNLTGTTTVSSPSSWVSKTYTSGQTAVATPTGFSVSRLSSGLRLVWNASPGADSYLIYRYDNRSNPFLGATGAVTSFDDTMYSSQGLVSGISYCYKIAAQKGSNTSPMTDYGCALAP